MGVLEYLQQDLLPRFVEFITAPVNTPEMLWMAVPLVTILFLMTFYFGIYKKEELGWNTAVGNSLVLVFVFIDLVRYMVTTYGFTYVLLNPEFYGNILLIAVIFVLGVWLLLMNFFHWLPKKVAFFVASPLPINIITYLALVVTYANVRLDGTTLLAALILFIILFLFFFIIKKILPTAKTSADLPTIEDEEEKNA